VASLDGRVALISGTGRGQGRAAALAFAAAGARVFGCDVLADDAEETVALVQDQGGEMRSHMRHSGWFTLMPGYASRVAYRSEQRGLAIAPAGAYQDSKSTASGRELQRLSFPKLIVTS
jgi:NAD(P)-dependent dehydrogenase (short-subunit alcohol dehydrogenase family)